MFRVYEHLQTTIDFFHVPSGIGPIPCELETGFSGLTADQYKIWVFIFLYPVYMDWLVLMILNVGGILCLHVVYFANGVSALVMSLSQMDCSFRFVDELRECMEMLL